MLIQVTTVRLSACPSGTKQYILNLSERAGQPEVNVLLLWCDSLVSLDSGLQESQVYGLSASANIHPSIKYPPLVTPRRQNHGGIKK